MNTIVKFPNQKKGMKFRTVFTGRRDDTIFSSRFQFSADQDPRKALTLDMKLADNRGNYTFDFLVEQPYTKLAFIVMAYAAAKDGRISTGVEFNYAGHGRYYDKYIVRTDINKITREAVFEIVSPKKHIEITGALDTRKQYSVSLNKRESGEKDMHATASISPNAKNMHLELNYDQANPQKVFHIDGEVMERKLMMKAYRTLGQQKVDRDGRLIIEMRPSSILFFQLLWNTQMLNEITDYGFALFKTYGQKIQTFGETIGTSVSEEFMSKLGNIKRVFKDDLEPITNYLPSVYNDIYNDIAKHSAKMAEVYSRNVFYMKTAGDSIMETWESMWSSYQNNLVHMKRQMQEFSAYVSDKLDEAKIMVDSYYSDFENGYKAAKAELFHHIDEMFLYVEQQFNNGFQHFTSLHEEINTYISKFPAVMKRVKDQIKKHPLIAEGVEYMVSMYEAMNDMKDEFVAQHGDISILSHPMVDLMLSISNDIYKHVLKSYGYLHLEEVIPDLKNKVIRFVKKEVATLKKALTSIDLKVLVFDPKNGEISAELYYQGFISAYNHLEDTSDSLDKVSRSLKKYSNKLSAFSDWTVYDTYYHVKPTSDIKNWVPPFKARASLFGGEHITTFDGRHLNFKGTCSYILARSEGNFKIVADYRNKGRQAFVESISITTHNGNRIRIMKDSTVQVNDYATKLPINQNGVYIHRMDDLIVVEGSNGYKVSCNPKSDYYIVDISGWYYNKVGGLFGTYDNEPTNDMTMSNMRATNDLQEFANSWSTSRSCRSQNHARGHMVPENRKCAEMFLEPSSPFRNCFKQVNPNPFYHACASYMTSVNKPLKVMCDVSAYYVNQCHYNDVKLPIPIRCSTH